MSARSAVRTARGFECVDATGDPGRFAAYLDAVAPILAAQKSESIRALKLAPGHAALDVGCGTGEEIRRMAALVAPLGRAVGVDLSTTLLAEARARTPAAVTAEYIRADAHSLPFADDAFEAARVERALQHVVDPATVIGEMARVVRPGGRIVAMEPDWHTLAFSGEDITAARTHAARIAHNIRNPSAGRRLPSWLIDAGVRVDRVEASTVTITSFATARHLLPIDETVDQLDTRAARAWREDLRQDDQGSLVATMAGFIVVGTICHPAPATQRISRKASASKDRIAAPDAARESAEQTRHSQ